MQFQKKYKNVQIRKYQQ